MFATRPSVSLDDAFEYQSAADDPVGYIREFPDVVTIDEVQKVPELVDAIKVSVDQNRQPGRFLLTGSANLLLVPGITESLAGRMEVIELQPLSEAEKTHADLRIWHYRDKSNVEVDAVLTMGDKTWAVEVKAGYTVRSHDIAGLVKLAEQCGEGFQKGIVFYSGTKTLPFAGGRILAVPLAEIWSR